LGTDIVLKPFTDLRTGYARKGKETIHKDGLATLITRRKSEPLSSTTLFGKSIVLKIAFERVRTFKWFGEGKYSSGGR
jgi:hypothetical protein